MIIWNQLRQIVRPCHLRLFDAFIAGPYHKKRWFSTLQIEFVQTCSFIQIKISFPKAMLKKVYIFSILDLIIFLAYFLYSTLKIILPLFQYSKRFWILFYIQFHVIFSFIATYVSNWILCFLYLLFYILFFLFCILFYISFCISFCILFCCILFFVLLYIWFLKMLCFTSIMQNITFFWIPSFILFCTKAHLIYFFYVNKTS